jgi:NADH dehydrogenase
VVIKLNTQVVDYKDDTVFLLTENIRNQKSNLGSWSYCQSFEGIPADSYGQNECNRFNKVNGTINIYAVEILVSNLLMKTFLKVIRR